MATSEITVTADSLRQFATELFARAGMPQADAEIEANVLVEADLRGVNTHGVLTVPRYVERLHTGVCNAKPNIRVIKETPVSTVMDADHALGQLASVRAMEVTIAKAKSHGMGLVGMQNSSHYGTAAYYAMMAMEQDLIGFSTTNTPPVMPATGGKTSVVGNNPFSWAVPAGKELPLVLDVATSVVARSKLILAQKKGEKIPFGWAVSADGKPTDDPDEAWKGLLLPIAGYKGFGLALILEVLCGVITGGPFGADLPAVEDVKARRLIGHFFMAIDPAMFIPINEFKARVDGLVRQVKVSEHAEGVGEVFLPGEVEYKTEAVRLKEGIPLPEKVVQELNDLAGNLGLSERL